MLSCIRCGGIGIVEKDSDAREAADPEGKQASYGAGIIGERLGEITQRLRRTRKEVEKRTKEIEKRLKPVKPFMEEMKKEAPWIEELGNTIRRGWRSLWKE
jgi:hypothetical protein